MARREEEEGPGKVPLAFEGKPAYPVTKSRKENIFVLERNQSLMTFPFIVGHSE